MRPTLVRVDYTEELVIMNRLSGQAVHEQSVRRFGGMVD